jgi:hypothetical protein|uniref:Uncharacterized protein n=1 Tax=viral metagenome TaxID=1070528 RepID=A0A6C0DF11_9ZZZZ
MEPSERLELSLIQNGLISPHIMIDLSYRFEWERISTLRVPYMDEVITNEPGHLIFDGYFYIEDGAVPLQRIICTREGDFHVEIYEKKTLEDTSEYGPYDEEEGGAICFFPTAIIELRYRVLQKIETRDDRIKVEQQILELEKDMFEREEECFRKRMGFKTHNTKST